MVRAGRSLVALRASARGGCMRKRADKDAHGRERNDPEPRFAGGDQTGQGGIGVGGGSNGDRPGFKLEEDRGTEHVGVIVGIDRLGTALDEPELGGGERLDEFGVVVMQRVEVGLIVREAFKAVVLVSQSRITTPAGIGEILLGGDQDGC